MPKGTYNDIKTAIRNVKIVIKKTSCDAVKIESNNKNFKIIKLSKTKYRVILGPFNDMKSLKDSYNKATILNFENLEIIKNV